MLSSRQPTKKKRRKTMAKIEYLIPHIIKWETSVQRKKNETIANLIQRAINTGVTKLKNDGGGYTCAGITLSTYRSYINGTATSQELGKMTPSEWQHVLRRGFWDRWQADYIPDQSVANMLVDWVWHSGVYGIKIPQKVLGVDIDGIVGQKTMTAILNSNPQQLFTDLKHERLAYIDRLCQHDANKTFKNGWVNRVESLTYLTYDDDLH